LRNLLQIKGVSHTLALKICASLGISKDTIYSNLAPSKVDKLNVLISQYRKKTTPFTFVLTHPTGSSDNSITPYGNYSSETKLEGNLEQTILFNPILTSLDEFKKDNIKMLISLNALRGRRLKQGYPVRGQRTRSNARTAKKLNR
jgi:small subunit ribosomal protein S13